jgi:hypothetical protein
LALREYILLSLTIITALNQESGYGHISLDVWKMKAFAGKRLREVPVFKDDSKFFLPL